MKYLSFLFREYEFKYQKIELGDLHDENKNYAKKLFIIITKSVLKHMVLYQILMRHLIIENDEIK